MMSDLNTAAAPPQKDRPTLDTVLAGLEKRAREADSLAELAFSMANDTHGLLGFRQALVFRGAGPKAKLMTLSGLAMPGMDTPYLVWLRRVWAWLQPQVQDHAGWYELPTEDVPTFVADGWREWWTRGIVVWPLKARDGKVLAWVIYLLDQPPADWQIRALGRLSDMWSYCWEMLDGHAKPGFWRRCGRPLKRWRKAIVLALLVLAGSVPIDQTVLAPAEVISLDSSVVAAPLDGVIGRIHVHPNQVVQLGDALFSLDDTVLRSQYDVALEAVAVADAELAAASQRMFQDSETQRELAVLSGHAHEKRAELDAIRHQLDRVTVRAQDSGVIVFGDADDWLGRPVHTGERIMLLADPTEPGMLIYLPVRDALALEPGSRVKLFLTVDPLQPLAGEVTETSYQVTMSPEGIASYRLRARFDETVNPEQARVGLQGTAKLQADTVSLAYYLLRRPMAATREWTGW